MTCRDKCNAKQLGQQSFIEHDTTPTILGMGRVGRQSIKSVIDRNAVTIGETVRLSWPFHNGHDFAEHCLTHACLACR